MNADEIYEIDRTLFIEREKLRMNASIQLNLVDFMMVKKMYELENKGVKLNEFAKATCGKKCRHAGWIQCIMSRYLCSEYVKN
jgi:hypothetical protein